MSGSGLPTDSFQFVAFFSLSMHLKTFHHTSVPQAVLKPPAIFKVPRDTRPRRPYTFCNRYQTRPENRLRKSYLGKGCVDVSAQHEGSSVKNRKRNPRREHSQLWLQSPQGHSLFRYVLLSNSVQSIVKNTHLNKKIMIVKASSLSLSEAPVAQ